LGKKIIGVIFSDMGEGASFMSLDWVQKVLRDRLGFAPYPATLNLRPVSQAEIARWNEIRQEIKGTDISPQEFNFCHARLFRVEIGRADGETEKVKGGVILPEVEGYPADKIEVVAPVRLKDKFQVRDGDHLSLEFVD
jgi:CTP-dependent riboflavin kinase